MSPSVCTPKNVKYKGISNNSIAERAASNLFGNLNKTLHA